MAEPSHADVRSFAGCQFLSNHEAVGSTSIRSVGARTISGSNPRKSLAGRRSGKCRHMESLRRKQATSYLETFLHLQTTSVRSVVSKRRLKLLLSRCITTVCEGTQGVRFPTEPAGLDSVRQGVTQGRFKLTDSRLANSGYNFSLFGPWVVVFPGLVLTVWAKKNG